MTAVLVLLCLFQLKHFLANYPLQCRYTIQGLELSKGWLLPMAARAAVPALLAGLLVLGYWLVLGKPVEVLLLLGVVAIDFASHFALDRAKVSPKLLGQFRVLSESEKAKIAKGYLSKDKVVVAEAQLLAMGNMFFWWGTGFINMLYVLISIGIVNLIA